jgi:transposase InsO family protein
VTASGQSAYIHRADWNGCSRQNRKFRDECLSVEWFRTRREAQGIIEAWRQRYNAVRLHSSLGYLTPNEFKQHHPLIHDHPTRAIS